MKSPEQIFRERSRAWLMRDREGCTAFAAKLPAQSATTVAAATELVDERERAGEVSADVADAARELLAHGVPCCSGHWTEALVGLEAAHARAAWLVGLYATDGSRRKDGDHG